MPDAKISADSVLSSPGAGTYVPAVDGGANWRMGQAECRTWLGIGAPSGALGNVTGTATFTRARVQTCTMTGSTTFSMPASPVSGDTIQVFISQDATGGRVATWPATSVLKWPNGIAGILTTTASATDVLTATYNGTWWAGVLTKAFG